jgi:hypothetical protein
MDTTQETARIRRLISMSTTDITTAIRAELKARLPGWVFSVKTPHYGAIDISLMSGPRQVFSRDYTESSWGEKFPINGHLNIGNHFNPNWDSPITDVLTKEAADILSKVFSICDQYNWDHSDLQSDYFDVHFYLSVEIGRWNKPYIVK